jgi:hypothetical protein
MRRGLPASDGFPLRKQVPGLAEKGIGPFGSFLMGSGSGVLGYADVIGRSKTLKNR